MCMLYGVQFNFTSSLQPHTVTATAYCHVSFTNQIIRDAFFVYSFSWYNRNKHIYMDETFFCGMHATRHMWAWGTSFAFSRRHKRIHMMSPIRPIRLENSYTPCALSSLYYHYFLFLLRKFHNFSRNSNIELVRIIRIRKWIFSNFSIHTSNWYKYAHYINRVDDKQK